MPWRDFKNQVLNCLKEADVEASQRDLEEPPEEVDADLAFPCFELGEEPKERAKELAEELKVKERDFIGKVTAEGPYLNFYLDLDKFAKRVFSEVDEGYGSSDLGRGQKILLEHTSVNPSGPIHVGRIRNSIVGDSLGRILSFAGYDVSTQYYVNDVGKQSAMIKYARENLEPQEELLEKYSEFKDKQDFELMFYYVAANKFLKEKEEARGEVEEMLDRLESGDGELLREMRQQAEYCLEGQRKVFDELDISFDSFFFESDLIQEGKVENVMEKLKSSEYTVKSDGALALDLSSFQQGRDEAIIQRKDGTSVYLTRDLAYHVEKAKRAEKLITILGEDHEVEGNELKIVLENILDLENEITPIFYSFVNFEGAELSTRKGKTAPVDELIQEAKGKAMEEIRKRDFSEATQDLAKKIGVGAIKYHIARTGLKKPINFSWEEALSFEGDAAPNIQYTYARASSILRKSDTNPKDFEPHLKKKEAKKLLKKISKMPLAVEGTAKNLRPHLVANYCWKASEVFNKFYQECPVIRSEGNLKKSRLYLVKAYRQTIQNALNLLGIQAPEKM